MGEPSMQLTRVFLIFLSVFLINGDVTNGQSASTSLQVLEDFSRAEQDGFPVGWQASRTESVTRKAYVVARDGNPSCSALEKSSRTWRLVEEIGRANV